MNKEKYLAQKIISFSNPLFLSLYAFIYYQLLLVLVVDFEPSYSLVLKSITLYAIVSCLLPIIILYLINNYSFENIKENLINSNHTYFIIFTSFFISYIYFSILNISIWLEIGMLIPVYASLIPLVLRKRMSTSLDIIFMGAITFYVFILTIQYYYIFAVIPLLIAILLSGLLAYAYQIQGLLTNKAVRNNYFIGCIISILITFFVLIV